MPQDMESDSELRNLAAVPYQIISPANNKPIVGIYQDSLLGCYRFTRKNINFTPRDAMNLLMRFQRVNETLLDKKERISNFQIMSQITPPITLNYKTKQFKDGEDAKNSNAVLEIINGKYVRGQMDKGVIHDGGKGLIQRICNDFGNMAGAQYIDDLQNVITEYMKTSCYSVGISDLIADESTNQKIVQTITNKKNDVKNLIDQTQLGVFENNSGKTNQEEFETKVNNILNQASSEAGKIGLKSLDADNRFVVMVNAGSKGSDLNISQMISCLGQQNVDGKRIPYGFDHRTLPHYTKFDDSPTARGFVESSYINGLSPQELFFHAMGGRIGLIDTAVKSVTWETPIVVIENECAKYTEIGKWIDCQLDANTEKVQHFTERQMELLNLENGDVFIPTTDENGVVTWGEVTAITRHDPGTELYEIKTSGGRSVIVTESKSLLIWNPETKKLKEMPTPEIKVGDCVPVTMELCQPPVILDSVDLSKYLPKNEYLYGSDFNKALKIMEKEMEGRSKIPSGWWNENNGTSFTLPYNKKSSLQRTLARSNLKNIKDGFVYPYHAFRKETLFKDKFELNESNGIFIGLFLAEGNVNKNCIYITNINENIKTFVKSWFDNQNIKWMETSRINKIGGRTDCIIGNCGVLAEFLTKFVGKGASNKYIPTDAFISQEEFVVGLLNGYFSGDGTISKNSIEVGSASKRLIEGVSMLCSRFGIFGKVFKTQLKSNNLGTKNIKPSYRLSIRAQWGEIFARKINLIEENKQQRLQSISWGKAHSNFETYNNVVLDKITEINIIGVEEHPKVYDLTIPSTLNFGLANGLQVRDTSTTGYIQRRLIKGLEDLMVNYDMTVRNNKGKVVEFSYGDDSIDTVKVETQSIPIVSMSVQDIYAHYNIPEEPAKMKTLSQIFLKNTMTRLRKQKDQNQEKCKFYTDMMLEMRESIIKNVFKGKDGNSVNCPVGFAHIINNIQGQQGLNSSSIVDITPLEALTMIETAYENLEKIRAAPPTQLFKTMFFYYLSPRDLLYVRRFNNAALTILLETIILNYKRAIVAPGEMVGMIAAQSIGEPTTQMSVRFCEHIRCVKINKETKKISMVSIKIGALCDKIIEEFPQYTFNTGHENSVETLLEQLEDEYYIIGVDGEEKTHWNKISHVSRHPVNGQMMKVTTKSGRTVETTVSHSHLVRDNQTVVPITGADLKEGMRIPVAKHIDNTFIQSSVTIGDKEYELDYLFGWFIGAYLAEGNINGNSICITNISQYFIENVKKFSERFDKEANVCERQGEYGPSTSTRFSCKELSKLLLETSGTGSFVKVVPDFAFLAPNEFKAGLIQAYFDGDGNFQCSEGHHQIRVCSRSEQLIKDISLLLAYFDIFGTIKSNFTRGSNIYNLAISPKYSELYKEHIGSLLHSEELQGLVDYIAREHAHDLSDEVDKINGLGEIIAKCGKDLKLPGQSRNYGRWKKKETIGRRTLQKYIQVFESHKNSKLIENELKILRQAANSHVIWDEIKKIEIYTPDQSDYVYDFTVPANQTFMTDYGVIVHNTLNTFHFAGVSSKSNVTRGVPRIEEILSLSENPKNPSLTVYLKPEEETDREKAQSIMYMLENTKMEELVKSIEICFDPDDLNTLINEDAELMQQYRAFENMVDECAEIAVSDETNEKSKWVLRMELNAEVMLEKNITMDDISFTLKNSYGDEVSCVYSDYNDDNLIFRIRMNNIIKSGTKGSKKSNVNPLDQSDQIYILKNFQDQLLHNIIIRGVKKIKKVILRKIKDNVVEQNGTYKKQDIWVLDTVGTNLLGVMALDYIDANRTFSNDIIEIYNVLGIEAARQSIYNEIADVIEFDGTYVNYHHMCMLCDRMTYNSKLISIFRHGINNDNIGPIAKASFEETPEMFLKAARHAELDNMRGVSANVMVGQEGLFGTNAFQVLLDIEEMNKLENIVDYNKKNEQEEIEKMFGQVESADDACSSNKLMIQNNVTNIKIMDSGEDNDYNPGF
uniref:DNA-directed RNA polymerase n=1 Tax=viral metagenome TaxID=1070528 RepID=A0A6C0KUM8_9ZZZZ